MASSLIRGKHLLSPASSGDTAVLYDAAVYQEDGVIKDVGPLPVPQGAVPAGMLNWAA